MKVSAALLVAAVYSASGGPATVSEPLPLSERAALRRISPDSLRGNLAFLSSDLLEGRDTPSRGLDIAAEFIADQLRKAKIEPAGDDGYFQTATLKVQQPDPKSFEMVFTHDGRQTKVPVTDVSLSSPSAVEWNEVPVLKVDSEETASHVTVERADGAVLLCEGLQAARSIFAKIPHAGGIRGVFILDRQGAGTGLKQELVKSGETFQHHFLFGQIFGEAATAFYASLKPGVADAHLTLHIAAPSEQSAKARNVIGVLRGSDPVLKNTAVVLSAHYDHLGLATNIAGDRVYNGANDDGSGTVSVIEVANALAHLRPVPKRSIVFVLFYGEEEGGFGARYYVQHPVFPLDKTVADLNLEQLGRTDSSQGTHINDATLTGFDYTTITGFLKRAGTQTRIRVYKDAANNETYFDESDNIVFAQSGIPALTLCVAYQYPDYHGLGDEWQKIDYANMAKVDRMIAAAVVDMANSTAAPRWNEANTNTAEFVNAAKSLHRP